MIRLPHLETNITTYCQNRCVGCNHLIPLQQGKHANTETIRRDMIAFGKIAHADIWAALGGEPLLHPAIDEVLEIAHESAIADRIEVITNGMRIYSTSTAFWTLTDILTVSVYPGKLDNDKLDFIKRMAASYQVELHIKYVQNEPFTAPLSSDHTALQSRARFRGCWYKTYCHVLDNGYFYRCCEMPFLAPLMMGKPAGFDGLNIHTASEADLAAYINQSTIPESCAICGGHGGEFIPYAQETDPAEWIRKSTK